MNRILAIDYGDVRIGIALSDPLKIISKPFDVIPNEGKEQFYEVLHKLIGEKKIDIIVIGLPQNMNGSFGFQVDKVKVFFKEFKNENIKRIVYYDERNSSSRATEVLHEQGINEKKQRKVKDAYAASIILKDFLQYGG